MMYSINYTHQFKKDLTPSPYSIEELREDAYFDKYGI